MFFSKTLCIEIHNLFVRVGYRNGRSLCGVERFDVPNLISNAALFSEIMRRYRITHKCGNRVILSISDKSAVARFVNLPVSEKHSLLRSPKTPDLTDVFPDDIAIYAVDYRTLNRITALACCIPKSLSNELAELCKSMALLPLGLDVYINCVSLALERIGGNAICVTNDGVIYISDGVLKEIITPAGTHELEVILDGASKTGVSAYNLGHYEWAAKIFDRAGLEVKDGDTLGLMGMLPGHRRWRMKRG